MNLQIVPFGLQAADPNWLIAAGDAAPSLRCVAAFDQNPFARGDVVTETGASIGGIAVVSSALAGTGYPYVYPKPGAVPLIVVAVAPAVPSVNDASPVLPGGTKGATGMLWVIPAGNREFLIAGDASTPARGEPVPSGETALTLHAQNLESGTLFARLAYGAPVGGVSGTTLVGGSFTDGGSPDCTIPGGHGPLQVLGLANGMPLAPQSLYRVRFRSFN